MKIKCKMTWGGSCWENEAGEKINLPDNFCAIDSESKEFIIVISQEEEVREMGSDYKVKICHGYKRDTLEEVDLQKIELTIGEMK